jgi:hypothetical protein
VSETATAEELRRGHVGHVELDDDPGERTHDAGGGPPPPGPPPARRSAGYGGGRLPRWQQLLLLGALVILAFVLGTLIGGAIEHRNGPRA